MKVNDHKFDEAEAALNDIMFKVWYDSNVLKYQQITIINKNNLGS